MYLFPWNIVIPDESIILYGAWNVGRAFLEQLRQTEYCNVIAVCDKNAEQLRKLQIPVIAPEELSLFPQVRIVIAVDKEKTAESIKKVLCSFGIDNTRII